MKILHETDTIVFAQEENEVTALATMAMIASTTALYAREELFMFIQRTASAIQAGCHAILYERASREAVVNVPVGYLLYGYFSRPVSSIFVNRLRPLAKEDYRSGKQLWLVDIVAPFGHSKELMAAVDQSIGADYDSYQLTRVKPGQVRQTQLPNRVRAEKRRADKVERAQAANANKE